ncbi:MAG TPA: caspase family protein [Herpetosiphonaceae bacterium]|nr:caspase family protein [Herpetosiphonaceae bacterium]
MGVDTETDPEAAIGVYRQTLEQSPRDTTALVGLATLYRHLKRYDEALVAYRQALAVDEHLSEAWIGMASALYHNGRYDEALAAYEQAAIQGSVVEALADTRAIRDVAFRVKAQLAVSSYLTQSERPGLLQELVNSAVDIEDVQVRRTILDQLRPQVHETLQRLIDDAIRGTPKAPSEDVVPRTGNGVFALLVGIDQYPSPVPLLKACANDVKAWDVLLGAQAAAAGMVYKPLMLLDQAATRDAVLARFREHLGQAGPNDVGVFIFSGHGSQVRASPELAELLPNGLQSTLVCYDSRLAERDDLHDHELLLLAWAVTTRGAHVALILDADHAASPLYNAAPDEVRHVLSRDPLASAVGDAEPDYGSVEGSYVILAACRADERSSGESVNDQTFSVFSQALINTLRLSGTITYRALLEQVQALVSTRNPRQTPQIQVTNPVDLDRPFLLMDLPATDAVPEVVPAHKDGVYTVALSPDNAMLASGGQDALVRIWELPSLRELQRFEGHTDRVEWVAFTPDGRSVVSVSRDRSLRIWDVVTGNKRLTVTGDSALWAVAVAPDGQTVAVGETNGSVRIFSVADGSPLQLLNAHRGAVRGVAFAPDGQRLASASIDRTGILWNPNTRRPLELYIGHTRGLWSVAFSPDGLSLATASDDQTVRLWDVATGQERMVLKGHGASVLNLAWTADGQRLLSCSQNNVLRVWDVQSGRQVARFAEHEDWVSSVAVTTNGAIAFSGSKDGTIRRWTLPELDALEDKPVRSRAEALAALRLVWGDFIKQRVDALVIPAGEYASQAGLIGDQIKAYLDQQVLDALVDQHLPSLGSTYVVRSGRMPARHLIFTRTKPTSRIRGAQSLSSVTQGIAGALDRAANDLDIHTLALPAIGTGSADLGSDVLAPPTLEQCITFLEQHRSVKQIRFCFIDLATYQVYAKAYVSLGGRIDPAEWSSRLSRAVQRAVALAEEICERNGAPLITPQHLLAGLCLVRGTTAERLLVTLVDDWRTRFAAFAGIMDKDISSLPRLAQSAEGVPSPPDLARVDADTLKILETAATMAEQRGKDKIRSRYLLSAILASENTASEWLAQQTRVPVQRLRSLIGGLAESESLSLARIRSVLGRDDVGYDVQLDLPAVPVAVDQEFELVVSLRPAGTGEGSHYTLEIDASMDNELEIVLDPQGLRLADNNAATLPIERGGDGRPGRALSRARFRVSALRPGRATIEALLYVGSAYRATLTGSVEVEAVDWVSATPVVPRPRPVPQPDLRLEVRAGHVADAATIRLDYRLSSPAAPYADVLECSSEPLAAGWIARARGVLATTIDDSAGMPRDEIGTRLRSFGRSLFRTVFPPELQQRLRVQGLPGQTLMVVTSRDLAIPWELVHDGQTFLGERYLIGHWLLELDDLRPYEFPVGQISLAHYFGVQDPEAWAYLLKPAGVDDNSALEPRLLERGVLDLPQVDSLRGLHVLRQSQPKMGDRFDAPVPLTSMEEGGGVGDDLRSARLNLRRNRPLVALGYLGDGSSELTGIEDVWIPTYLHAGCSAFIGPRWAVRSEAEATFAHTLYSALWAGESLGQAFQRARLLVRETLIDSVDWLAYVLVGDPLARAYRPIPGEGYAVVEPIGRRLEDPLQLGQQARFRVSLRRTPPIWHEERVIEVVEELKFANLEARIAAPGLEVLPGGTVPLFRTPDGNYQGWFMLSLLARVEEPSVVVQISYRDGRRRIQNVMFELVIDNGTGGAR